MNLCKYQTTRRGAAPSIIRVHWLPGDAERRWHSILARWVLLVSLAPLSCAVVAGQETSEEALERLDGVIETLRDVRDTTRGHGTLEAALESSVSAYSCTRFWGLGMLAGSVGGSASASAKAEMAFRLFTPWGTIQTYAQDNGAPLHVGVSGTVGQSVALDSYAGLENWNCWRDDLPFSPPNPYDVSDYETPLEGITDDSQTGLFDTEAYPGMARAVSLMINNAHAQYTTGMVDEGFEQAVLVLNALAAMIRDIGLDPSNPAVIDRLLTDGGVSAREALQELMEPGLSLPQRLARAPDQLVGWLSDFGPGGVVVDSVESFLSADWVDGTDMCSLLPYLADSCGGVRDYAEAFLQLFVVLEQVPTWVGDGVDSIASIASELFTEAEDRLAAVSTEKIFDPVYYGVTYARATIGSLFNPDGSPKFGPMIDEAIRTTIDAYYELTDLKEQIETAFTSTQTISATKTFPIPFHGSVTCQLHVSFKPSEVAANESSGFYFNCY